MLWVLGFVISNFVFAHQTSLTPSGKDIYWPKKDISISIKSTTSDLSSSTVKSIFANSISEWNSTGAVNLVNSNSSSINEVKFTSDFETFGSAVIGLTELSYNESGAVNKATILLNDNYEFTANPSSFSSGSIYLGDVLTHELGHFLGLSHSEVLDSSMFYSSFPGQYEISSDDKAGILQKYGPYLGTIKGYVRGGNQVGVLGAHVQIISRSTGDVVGVITDENGYFVAKGLPLNDSYYIYTSPIKNPSSLPGFFANVQTDFCPNEYSGSFFSECGREFDGIPQAINLTTEDKTVDVGVVTINCGLRVSEDYASQKISDVFDPVPIVTSDETDFSQKAFVGYFSKAIDSVFSESDWETLSIDLTNFDVNQERLIINFLSYPFGSQLEYEMKLLRNGTVLSTAGMSNSPLTGTYNNNMRIEIRLSQTKSQNDYELKIRAKKMSNSVVALTFPDYEIFSSSDYLPHLIILSLEDDGVPKISTSSHLSDNESCLDAPFTFEVSNARIASTEEANSSSAEDSAGCGSVDVGNNGPGNGNGPSLFFGFFLGSVILSFMLSLGKKAKIILS